MYFRTLKKSAGDLSLSEAIDSDKDGNTLSLYDVLCSEDTILSQVLLEMNVKRLYELLDEVQQGLYAKAKRNLDEHTYAAYSLEEAKELQERNGGFIKTMWCGDLQCELDMKEKAGMSSRCIPFAQEKLGEVCACCGKPAKHMIYWGVAY